MSAIAGGGGWNATQPLETKLDEILANQAKMQTQLGALMSATTDLQAGQAAIDKAVSDTAAYLKTLAGTISGGVSAADAETIATDLNTQAAALEAAIAPPAAAPAPVAA